jgi:predicted RNA-binding protein with RPS1 domain
MNRILSLSVWTALLLGLTACNKPADSANSGNSNGAPAGTTEGGTKRKIAFVSNGVAAFWTIASAGVKTAGEKLGVDAQTLMPVEGISDQKRMIEDLLTKGVDGLLHISNLGSGRVEKVEDVLNRGDSVDVRVEEVDRARGRIGLRLLSDDSGPSEGAAEDGGDDDSTHRRPRRRRKMSTSDVSE